MEWATNMYLTPKSQWGGIYLLSYPFRRTMKQIQSIAIDFYLIDYNCLCKSRWIILIIQRLTAIESPMTF